jgi:hypothetical protein
MGDMRRMGQGCVLRQAEDQQQSPKGGRYREQHGPHVFTYCVIAGAVATTVGAVVSIAAAGVPRMVTWSLVIVSVSVVAGLAYDSGPVKAMWYFSRQLLRRVYGS